MSAVYTDNWFFFFKYSLTYEQMAVERIWKKNLQVFNNKTGMSPDYRYIFG